MSTVYVFKHKRTGYYYRYCSGVGGLVKEIKPAYKLKTKYGARNSKVMANSEVYISNCDPGILTELPESFIKSKGLKRDGLFAWNQSFKVTMSEFVIEAVTIMDEDYDSYGWESLYVARDADGSLCIFSSKPIKNDKTKSFVPAGEKSLPGSMLIIPEMYFPEVTYENSPKPLKMHT